MAIDFVISIMIMGGWFLSQTILEGKLLLVYEERKLVKVTVPSGSVYSYQYSENGRIKELVNAREVHAVCNEYDKKIPCCPSEICRWR